MMEKSNILTKEIILEYFPFYNIKRTENTKKIGRIEFVYHMKVPTQTKIQIDKEAPTKSLFGGQIFGRLAFVLFD